MIYLIFKMFVYLLVSTGAGFAAGWLLNQLRSDRAVASAQEASNSSRTVVPQLESTIRAREQEIDQARARLKECETSLADIEGELKETRKDLRAQIRESENLKAQVAHLEEVAQMEDSGGSLDGFDGSGQDTDLKQRNADLIESLNDAQERIKGLEKERDLQHNSLKVLHAQLELKRGAAAG
jgi:chromosome segregation ATPase